MGITTDNPPSVAPVAPSGLQSLNTHFVANAGLGGVFLGLGGVFTLIENPDFLIQIYQHNPTSYAQLAGALITAAVGGLASYFGRPKTVPAGP